MLLGQKVYRDLCKRLQHREDLHGGWSFWGMLLPLFPRNCLLITSRKRKIFPSRDALSIIMRLYERERERDFFISLWDLRVLPDTDGKQWPELESFEIKADGYFSIRRHWNSCAPRNIDQARFHFARNLLLPGRYSNVLTYSVFTDERQGLLAENYIKRARPWCCDFFPCSRVM